MKYYVAESYKDAEKISEPFEENGKLYVNIKMKCDRCGGTGVYAIGVKNGVPVPIPVDGGVCYKCGGKGYEEKIVRVYTEKEYKTMQKRKEQNRLQKEKEREERYKQYLENLDNKRKEILVKNGFTEDGMTYMLLGNTFEIMDELKEKGCKFDKTLMWHCDHDLDCGEGIWSVQVSFDDLFVWNDKSYTYKLKEDWFKTLDAIKAESYKGISEYVGEVGERIHDIKGIFVSVRDYEGAYGLSHCYSFMTDNNKIVWWTAKELELEENDWVSITGTVKKQEIYNGEKVTYLNRCKVEVM